MRRRIEFHEADTFEIDFEETEKVVINFGEISQTGGSVPVYPGPYTVNPDFVGLTLPTRGKNMREDVTVNAIEVQRVSNPTGGKTVYIGGIIDG